MDRLRNEGELQERKLAMRLVRGLKRIAVQKVGSPYSRLTDAIDFRPDD